MALLSDVADMLPHCRAYVGYYLIAPASYEIQPPTRYMDQQVKVKKPTDVFLENTESYKRKSQPTKLLCEMTLQSIAKLLSLGVVDDMAWRPY